MSSKKSKQKTRKTVWLWGLVAALVIAVGATAYYMPETEWFQGFMRWGRGARISGDARLQPGANGATRVNEAMKLRITDELRPEIINSQRDLDGAARQVKELQRDFDEKTLAYQKLKKLQNMIDMTRDNPDLLRALKAEMADIVDMSWEELAKEAKVLKVMKVMKVRQDADADRVLRSFRVRADADADFDKVALILMSDIDQADFDPADIFEIEADGVQADGVWSYSSADADLDIYEYTFNEPLSVSADDELQIDLVYADSDSLADADGTVGAMELDADSAVTADTSADMELEFWDLQNTDDSATLAVYES